MFSAKKEKKKRCSKIKTNANANTDELAVCMNFNEQCMAVFQ